MRTAQGISNLHNLTILSIQSNRLTSLGTPSNNSSNKTTDISNNGNKEHAKAKTDIINGTQPNTAAKVDNTTIENPNNTINSSNLPLSYLTSLTELHVSHNALTSLTGLSAGPESLRTLDISSNPLSSLVGLEPLKNLEELWASNCQLDDWREVERGIGTEVSGKHALETVYLEGNPVQRKQPALYRGKVKLLVPGVRQIDASEFCILSVLYFLTFSLNVFPKCFLIDFCSSTMLRIIKSLACFCACTTLEDLCSILRCHSISSPTFLI